MASGSVNVLKRVVVERNPFCYDPGHLTRPGKHSELKGLNYKCVLARETQEKQVKRVCTMAQILGCQAFILIGATAMFDWTREEVGAVNQDD